MYKTTYSEDVCSLHTCFSAYLLYNAMRKFGMFFFGPPGISGQLIEQRWWLLMLQDGTKAALPWDRVKRLDSL